jgi:hypothetical protein
MEGENVIEISAGKATKNDIMQFLGRTLEALGENHRGGYCIPLYKVSIKIEEAGLV